MFLVFFSPIFSFFFFFFNDTATTEIYTLSLHDALPICRGHGQPVAERPRHFLIAQQVLQFHALAHPARLKPVSRLRSEEHTSELQSHSDLVCRLLLEKKK